ncbi:MAG: hypothetical protein Q7T18_05620 [Sedimentisphaerales bacterium]|nr:hypothetical protein [Sedimentisphaerales bacterium]
MIKSVVIVAMVMFLFSGQPSAYADNERHEGREEMKKDREALKKDREKLREDRTKLKEDREKMREERKAHREERHNKREQKQGGGNPTGNVSGAPTNPGTGVHASGN